MALVHALNELVAPWKFRFEIAHINHGLRAAASEADQKFVKRLAREAKVPFHVKHCTVPTNRGNLEEMARERRYAALLEIAKRRKVAAIFTAHTLDDQVETVIMNMLRGTGPDGLAGMSEMRCFERSRIWLARPFLTVTKKELLEGLRRSNRQFRIDESNRDEKFLRNWLRQEMLPMLEKRSPGFKKRIANLARVAADEKKYWQQETKRIEQQLLRPYKEGRLLDLGGLLSYSPAVQRRFLRRALGRDILTYDAVERLREWMQAPPSSGRLWQLKQGWTVERLSKTKGSPSAQLFWFKKSNPEKEKQFL